RSEPAKTNSTDVRDSQAYGEMRSGLFSRPSAPESVPAPKQAESTAPQTRISDPAVPIDPFAQVVYTGTVTIGDEKQALLENQRTKEGWYLHQGDPFMGAKIVRIDDSAVTLNVHGQMRRIPKSNVYNLVPLDAQAGSTPTRNASDPRGPGGPGGAYGAAINSFGANNSFSGGDAEKFYQSNLGAATQGYGAAMAERLTADKAARDLSVSYEKVPLNTSISIITNDAPAVNAQPAQVEFTIGLGKEDIKL
ncbi:MAG: hypothetical protein JWN14_2511, partial [Chthonomonadales bacterium]|nr:hypothetical protein [Chthonomonadales bacterium]